MSLSSAVRPSARRASLRLAAPALLLLAFSAACDSENTVNNTTGTDPIVDDLVACIEVSPATIDFGDLQVGVDAPLTRTVTVTSTCEADLELAGVDLVDLDAPFELGALGAVRLPQGATTTFDVTFNPGTASVWTTDALVASNADGQTTIPVRLSGGGIAPVIEITPPEYDFGAPYIGCSVAQPYTIRNVGNANLVISDIAFTSGSTDFVFESAWSGTEIVLPPGAATWANVTYLGLDDLRDDAFITVRSNDPWSPETLASASASARHYRDQQDLFEQPLLASTDILFVVDNSCSMAEEQSSMASNFEAFVDTLETAGTDYRLGVITTDNYNFRGEFIDADSPDPVGSFQDQAQAGTNGSGDERGMEMAYQATQSGRDAGPDGEFLREQSTLSVIVLSDEEDSSYRAVDFYIDYWLGLKNYNPDLVRFNAIAGPSGGCATAVASERYSDAAAATGGEYVSICSTDWGENMESVALGSISLSHRFALSAAPVVTTIEVRIDNVVTSVGWGYDPVNNAVFFSAEHIPDGGSTVDIRYEVLADCDQ